MDIRSFYDRIARRDAQGLELAWDYALRTENDSMAGWLVRLDTATDKVLDAARDSRRPALRAAWLLRPGRTRDELVGALKSERRGEVLAAVCKAAPDDVTLQRELARLRKRPVAMVQAMHSDDDEVLCETVAVLDAWCQGTKVTRAVVQASQAAVRKLSDAAVGSKATTWSSPQVLCAVAVRKPAAAEVREHLVTQLVPLAVQGIKSWDYQAQREGITALTSLVENPYLSADQVAVLRRAVAGERRAVHLFHQLTNRANGAVVVDLDSAEALSAALSGDDPALVAGAWSRLGSHDRARRDLGNLVAHNEHAPDTVKRELALCQVALVEELAGALDAETAATLLARHQVSSVLSLRPDLRDEVVPLALAKCTGSWSFESLVDHLTDDELMDAPWSVLGRGSSDRLDSLVVDGLGEDQVCWTLFEQLQFNWPGTVRDLVDTCAAAAG